jgi:hypothetical protein
MINEIDVINAKRDYENSFLLLNEFIAAYSWYQFWDWGEYERLQDSFNNAERRYLQIQAVYSSQSGDYSPTKKATVWPVFVAGLIAVFIIYKIVKK